MLHLLQIFSYPTTFLVLLLEAAQPSIASLLGLPAIDWLVVVVGIVILGWFILSNWEKLERVAGWLSAGRRRREAAIIERLDKAEREIRDFVGKTTLEEQFMTVDNRLSKHSAALLTWQGAHHDLIGRVDALTGDQRRTDSRVTELAALNPRVAKVESDILLLLQQMQALKEGQQEIKAKLEKVGDESHEDREAILRAIQNIR